MNHLSSWGMLDVYLLGILIAAVKISENATVVFGIAFWCICTLIVLLILSNNILQKNLIEEGFSNHGKKDFSHSVALLISAMIMMLPANLLPIMVVTNLGDTSAETILGGIIHLAIAGSWHLSIVIFIASLLVPVLKIFYTIYAYSFCSIRLKLES